MQIDLSELFGGTTDLDVDIVRTLLKALKSEHNNEFDFISFKQSVQNLKAMNMDEETSFKSAFATASTMGMTKAKLLQSAKKYQNALESERISFANALKNQMEIKVNGKKEEAELLKKRIESYKQKIEDMKREMSAYQEKIDTVDETMASAKQKISETKDRFEKAYNSINSSIGTDLNQIEKYL